MRSGRWRKAAEVWRAGGPLRGVTLPNRLHGTNHHLPDSSAVSPAPKLSSGCGASTGDGNPSERKKNEKAQHSTVEHRRNILGKPGYVGTRGAQRDTAALRPRASFFPTPLSATSSSPGHSVLPISLLSPKPCGAAPSRGGTGDRRLRSSVPRVQTALCCRCPPRSERPGRVGAHKRPPTSGPPLSPLLPGGARGPQRQLPGRGRGKRSTEALPGVHPGERARRGHETGSLGQELQRASEDSAEPPTAPLPSPSRGRSSAGVRERRNSRDPLPRAPGLPRRAPGPAPRDPCGPATPLHSPKGAPSTHQAAPPLSSFPSSGRGRRGGADIPSRSSPACDPEGTEPRNRNSPTSLRGGFRRSLQKRRRRRRRLQQHRRGVPARPPPARPDARRGLRGGRGERGGGARSPSSPLGPSGGAPPARPPSALPVEHRRQALGSERELFVSPPRLGHRKGWGREAGLRSPRHRPSPAAPPPTPLPSHLPAGPGLKSVRPESQTTHGLRSRPPSPARSLGLASKCPTSAGTSTLSPPRRASGTRAGIRCERRPSSDGRRAGLRQGQRPAGTSLQLGTWGPSEGGVEIVTFPETALGPRHRWYFQAAPKSSCGPGRAGSCFGGGEDASKEA